MNSDITILANVVACIDLVLEIAAVTENNIALDVTSNWRNENLLFPLKSST